MADIDLKPFLSGPGAPEGTPAPEENIDLAPFLSGKEFPPTRSAPAEIARSVESGLLNQATQISQAAKFWTDKLVSPLAEALPEGSIPLPVIGPLVEATKFATQGVRSIPWDVLEAHTKLT